MTGEGFQFIIFNQPESVCAVRAVNINHFLKGEENEKVNYNLCGVNVAWSWVHR
jgi:hypothetical protein